MAKRTNNNSVNPNTRQPPHSSENGMQQLLAAQQASLGELTSIKSLLELSKEVKSESSSSISNSDIQEKLLDIAKEHLKSSKRYYKAQDEFKAEWDVEAKHIAEMAKGMKVFKTLGEKMQDKREGLAEKFGIANGGLKKTVLGALNVGGVFNKTLARDEFIERQKALGAAPMQDSNGKVVETAKDFKKRLNSNFEGANAATKSIQKNEKALDKLKSITGITNEEQLNAQSPAAAKLFANRTTLNDNLGKYDRGTNQFSPDMKNAKMAGLLPTSTTPELGKTPTATAAESVQSAEVTQETKKSAEETSDLLKAIVVNTGGDKNKQTKSAAPVAAPTGGGLLDTIMSFLGDGLMAAFKRILNPMSILKAWGKVFAIGMIVGALFEGVMDGFDEFMKTGDIGKALIAGLAGIIDFLTFGLFDKEKIKEVIGDFSKWTYDHLVKPFVNFISGIKDSFMSMLEGIGIPKIDISKFSKYIPGAPDSIGPFYPFKSSGTPQSTPQAIVPTDANQVETQSAQNAAASGSPAGGNITNVVNAPVTTNNNTTQVQMRPTIRNQESSQDRYMSSRYT